MNETERAVFAACYAMQLSTFRPAADNRNAEAALEYALEDLDCFRQAARDRGE
jgi:hypothetical protein